MKLLVDSGSTKADWVAIDESGTVLFNTHTLGLNPEILEVSEIINRLNSSESILHHKKEVTHVFFYGAGCGTDRMKDFLKTVFSSYFPNATIAVYEDTYAAVYATADKGEKAIVSILGTGSNCSYFDGEILHQKVQSLGYIVMDDCSGNRFGRHLLRGYYFNKMPLALATEFEQTYDVDADVIKQNLYKEANPNAYLATFAGFLIKHKDTDYCQKIIFEEIESFVANNFLQFENYKEVPAHFIGSVAFYLRNEIKTVLDQYGITLGKVIQRPIDGLIQYHTHK